MGSRRTRYDLTVTYAITGTGDIDVAGRRRRLTAGRSQGRLVPGAGPRRTSMILPSRDPQPRQRGTHSRTVDISSAARPSLGVGRRSAEEVTNVTRNRGFRRLVRARMGRTRESYTASFRAELPHRVVQRVAAQIRTRSGEFVSVAI